MSNPAPGNRHARIAIEKICHKQIHQRSFAYVSAHLDSRELDECFRSHGFPYNRSEDVAAKKPSPEFLCVSAFARTGDNYVERDQTT